MAKKQTVSDVARSLGITPMDSEKFSKMSRYITDPSELPEFCTAPKMNRFYDILPNPKTRVLLRIIDKDPKTEYYNANYIRGYGGRNKKAYVAASAPMAHQVETFLRLIWEQRCSVVVMATGLIEKNKIKCERYWPEHVYKNPGDEVMYGRIKVANLGMKNEGAFCRTMLRISVGKESRNVLHFWYNTWPDHGVPVMADGSIKAKPVLDLLLQVRSYRAKADGGKAPVLVHCSAGIGRTGTLLAIDHAIVALQCGNKLDVNEIIEELRRDRMAMVQHTEQYKFAFHAILLYARVLANKSPGKGIQPNQQQQQQQRQQQRKPPQETDNAPPLPQKAAAKPVYVTNTEVPSSDSDDILIFKVGEQVEVLEETEHWWRVAIGDREGWIQPDHLDLQPQISPKRKAAMPFPTAKPKAQAQPKLKAPVAQTKQAKPKPVTAKPKEEMPEAQPSFEDIMNKVLELEEPGDEKPAVEASNPFADSAQVPESNPFATKVVAAEEDSNPFATPQSAQEPEAPAAVETFEDIMEKVLEIETESEPVPEPEPEEPEEEEVEEPQSFEDIMNKVLQIENSVDDAQSALDKEFESKIPVGDDGELSDEEEFEEEEESEVEEEETYVPRFYSDLQPWTFVDANGLISHPLGVDKLYKVPQGALDDVMPLVREPFAIIGPAVVSHDHIWHSCGNSSEFAMEKPASEATIAKFNVEQDERRKQTQKKRELRDLTDVKEEKKLLEEDAVKLREEIRQFRAEEELAREGLANFKSADDIIKEEQDAKESQRTSISLSIADEASEA